jgi:hypothetical protein
MRGVQEGVRLQWIWGMGYGTTQIHDQTCLRYLTNANDILKS